MPRREIVLALVGLAMVGAGVFWWRSGGAEVDKIEVIEATESQSVKVVVDVGGAVNKPGLYEMKVGDRVGDLLGRAELTADADTKWIEMYLNRAEVVKDGMKIYIPRVEESKSGRAGVETKMGKININSASQTELEGLPGIGPVTAKKIIDGRPYGRIEELQEKKIVGQKVWEQIKESISVW